MKKGIIWLASYPKSGNTFVRLFLCHYLFSNENKLDFAILKKILKFESKECFSIALNDICYRKDFIYYKHCIDVQEKLIKTLPQDKLIFKTHHFFGNIDGYDFTNQNNTLAFIFLVRDPREVICSYSHYTAIPLDKQIEYVLLKDAVNYHKWETKLNWSLTYKTWKAFKTVPSLFIKFEDLIKYPFETLSLTINFLSNISNITYDEDKIKNIIKLISFENLKRTEKEKGFFESPKDRVFFRNGKIDSWKDILNYDQIKKIESDCEEVMKELNYL